MKNKPNGYVVYENNQIAVIATGFTHPSDNPKTGPMIQVYILVRNIHPVEAIRSGKDSLICGDCPLRQHRFTADAACYVNVGFGPAQVWKSYRAGKYPRMQSTDIFSRRAVRFGAYGDPTRIPLPLLEEIAGKARRFTGYTHQHKNPLFYGYRRFLMASVENVEGQIAATQAGWRTFRVRPAGSDWKLSDEVVCPASNEAGHKVQCQECGLCGGNSVKAKSVVIQAH
jgi:hypothetical protein